MSAPVNEQQNETCKLISFFFQLSCYFLNIAVPYSDMPGTSRDNTENSDIENKPAMQVARRRGFFGNWKSFGQIRCFPILYKLPKFNNYLYDVFNKPGPLKKHEKIDVARTLFRDLKTYFEEMVPVHVMTKVLYTFIQSYPMKVDQSTSGFVSKNKRNFFSTPYLFRMR